MKVECIALLDELGRPTTSSSWISVGKIYSVLSIEVEMQRPYYRLLGESTTPALFVSEMFRIVTNGIPRSWVVSSPGPSRLFIGPRQWCRETFWSEYFDGVEAAVEEFAAALSETMRDE